MARKNVGLVLIFLVAGCGSPSGTPSESAPTPGPSPSPASGAGVHEAAKVDELRLPGNFYDLPDPIPKSDPGDLLKLTVRVNDPNVRIYRALYRSTTVDGTTPVAVTGEIWIPGGLPPAGGFPIVAFGPGFGGVGDDCAYSIHPEWGYEDLLEALVDDGFVVASTDWEGHGTRLPYMDSVMESSTHSLLDGARAAMDLLGPVASNQVLIVGHSLGGVAAAQLLLHGPAYDEGLDIRGVVSMEGIGDFERPDDQTPGPDDVGVLDTLRVARSWSFGYPELKPEDVLTPAGVELLSRIDEDGTCDEVFWLELNGKPLHEIPLLEVTTIDWMTVESWAARIRAQTVRDAPYPVFYVMAEGTPFAARVRDVADRLCGAADHVAYRAYPTDHDGVVDMAYADFKTWIQERLAGDGSFDGCDF